MSADAQTDIRIALPNKGRLSERALALLEQAGLPATFSSDRALVAALAPGYQAIFVRAQDVPEFVADGAAEAGVTGADLIAESARGVDEVLDLEFGKCRLVVAIKDDSTVGSVAELPAGTRVATSFPGLARRFFQDRGVEAEIAQVSGAAEIAPHLGVADVIVDLVSTGSTLRVNGLRELDTVLASSARLVLNREARVDPDSGPRLATLVTALESVVRARSKRYLMANVPRDRLDEVRATIPGISGPTVVDVLDRGAWVAAHAVVDADSVFETVARLKELGAEGILVTRIERLVP